MQQCTGVRPRRHPLSPDPPRVSAEEEGTEAAQPAGTFSVASFIDKMEHRRRRCLRRRWTPPVRLYEGAAILDAPIETLEMYE